MSFIQMSSFEELLSLIGDEYIIGLAEGKNVRINVDLLANMIAPFVPGAQSGYISTTGSVLPNPIATPSGFTIVGLGNFTQTTGAAIQTSGLLNVLKWISNGSTGTWSVASAINTGDLVARNELFSFGAKNVFNGSLAVADTLWNTDIAQVGPSSSGRVFFGYQPAVPNKEYTLYKAAGGAVFFDANKNPIGYAETAVNGKPAMANLTFVKTLEQTNGVIARFVTMPGTAFIGGNGISGHTLAQVIAEMSLVTQGAVGQISKELIPDDVGHVLLSDGATTGSFAQAIKENQNAVADIFGIATLTVDSFNESLVMPDTLFNTDSGDVDPSTTGRVFSGYQPVVGNKEYSFLKCSGLVALFDSAKNPIGYVDAQVNNKQTMANLEFVKALELVANVKTRFVTTPGTAYIGANNITGHSAATVQAEMQILSGGAATGEKKIKEEYLPELVGAESSRVPIEPEELTYFPGKRFELKPRGGLYWGDLFNVASGNLQGIAYGNGKVYVSYDIGNGNTSFRVYDYSTGALLKTVASLPCGHAGDLDYNPYTGMLYVSTYGSNLLTLNVVNIDAASPSIVKTFDDKRGNISIDPDAKKMYTSYLMPDAPYQHRITVSDMNTGVNEEPFYLNSLGNIATQGSAYNNGKLYVLAGISSLIIYVIDVATKTMENVITKAGTVEPEGFAIVNDALNPFFIHGFRNQTMLKKMFTL